MGKRSQRSRQAKEITSEKSISLKISLDTWLITGMVIMAVNWESHITELAEERTKPGPISTKVFRIIVKGV